MHPGGGDRNEKDSDRSSRDSNHRRYGNWNVQQRERLVGLVAAGVVTGAVVGSALAPRPYYYPYGYYPYGQSPYYGPRCGPVWNGYNWVPAC
jgi:hypothetical protein